MNRILVIGAGPGPAEGLTLEALRALGEADAVYAAQRYAGLVPPEKRRALLPIETSIRSMEQESREGRRTAVLVSGDAGFYSLLGRLREELGAEALQVIPGVGSVQTLCARLRIGWEGAAFLSAHGRELPPSVLCHTAATNARTFVLLDALHGVRWVRQTLDAGGLGHVRLIVGSDLGGAGEAILTEPDKEPAAPALTLLENGSPRAGLPPAGLEDAAFARGAVPMTKREIRVQALALLRLPADAVVWDIGAGTGSVSVECARQCPYGQVLAVEREPEALPLIRENIRRFRLQNVTVAEGEAPEALRALPCPTHAFVGGSGGRLQEILEALEALPSPVRVCASAVTLENAARLNGRMKTYGGFEAVQLSVSRLEPAGGVTMLRAQNPVFLFAGTTGGQEKET